MDICLVNSIPCDLGNLGIVCTIDLYNLTNSIYIQEVSAILSLRYFQGFLFNVKVVKCTFYNWTKYKDIYDIHVDHSSTMPRS